MQRAPLALSPPRAHTHLTCALLSPAVLLCSAPNSLCRSAPTAAPPPRAEHEVRNMHRCTYGLHPSCKAKPKRCQPAYYPVCDHCIATAIFTIHHNAPATHPTYFDIAIASDPTLLRRPRRGPPCELIETLLDSVSMTMTELIAVEEAAIVDELPSCFGREEVRCASCYNFADALCFCCSDSSVVSAGFLLLSDAEEWQEQEGQGSREGGGR
jgi:hypothetical protein